MTFEEFLAEIKNDLSQYFESGLIDDPSVLKWVTSALKKFGATIMVYQEAVVEINKGTGKMPTNFYSLKKALKCEKDFIECDEESEKILVKSLFWTDVQMKQKEWNIKTGACINNEVEEFTIREKTYIDGKHFNKYYKNPVELRLSTSFKKSLCDNDCYNKYRSDSPYELNIIGNTMYTNFKEGEVYIKYKGLELDEDGLVVIPDTPKGELETYLTYFVKRNIFEIVMTNGDDVNVANLFKYYLDAERMQLGLALTEAKFAGLTPQSLYKLRGRNQAERARFERFPKY